MDLNKIIFKDKKISDIISEIYDNQKNKRNQIKTLIGELKPLITDIGNATLLVPLIKEYLDIDIKNDDQLIKLTNIIVKLEEKDQDIKGNNLSEKEKEELLKSIETLRDDKKTD